MTSLGMGREWTENRQRMGERVHLPLTPPAYTSRVPGSTWQAKLVVVVLLRKEQSHWLDHPHLLHRLHGRPGRGEQLPPQFYRDVRIGVGQVREGLHQ